MGGAITSFITVFSHTYGLRLHLSPSLCVFTAAVSRESEMAAKEDGQDPRIPKIASSIRVIPDFPKPGLPFVQTSLES